MTRRGLGAESVLFSVLALTFLLMNVSFNGWHGGSSFGPRYLIPAIPFLALALVNVKGGNAIAHRLLALLTLTFAVDLGVESGGGFHRGGSISLAS